MGGPRRPYMRFWVDDFFGSARVAALSRWAQAVYAIALLRAWQFGEEGLPADRRELGHLLFGGDRRELRRWREEGDGIVALFEEIDGRLHSPRIKNEMLLVSKVSTARKRAAKSRWLKPSNGAGEAMQLHSKSTAKAEQLECYPKPYPDAEEEEDKSIEVPSGTSHPTTAVPAPLGSGGEDDSTDSPESPKTHDVARRRAQGPDMAEGSCQAENVAQSGEEPPSRARSSRIVPAAEWSEYVSAWNAAAAPNGLPCASFGKTALSTQSRRRFHAIAPAESDRRELFARVLAEVDQSAPGILALSGGRWFSLHWLFAGQGTHVEKFVAGQYRRTSSAEAERDARIRRALAEEDAAC